jgi:hypothetical protein
LKWGQKQIKCGELTSILNEESLCYENKSKIFGYVDSFHPFKHYGDTWTHPAGATEDGGERHKLLCTAIIEKQDRISYQELKDVWLRDFEITHTWGDQWKL